MYCCPYCEKRIKDLDELETDRVWVTDKRGTSIRNLIYQCPKCKNWYAEDEFEEVEDEEEDKPYFFICPCCTEKVYVNGDEEVYECSHCHKTFETEDIVLCDNIDEDDLPTLITVNINDLSHYDEQEDNLDDAICEYLSDTYGYCVFGFDITDMDTVSGDITVDNIDWDTED